MFGIAATLIVSALWSNTISATESIENVRPQRQEQDSHLDENESNRPESGSEPRTRIGGEAQPKRRELQIPDTASTDSLISDAFRNRAFAEIRAGWAWSLDGDQPTSIWAVAVTGCSVG